MKIAFGCDHAGFEGPDPRYKPAILAFLSDAGHEVVDCGCTEEDARKRPNTVDYPDYANAVCRQVLDGDVDCGILLCGTGIGVSITANRYKGIRAATCCSVETATLSRTHNDANVLCLGRRVSSLEEVLAMIQVWLSTDFSGVDRHQRRVAKMG